MQISERFEYDVAIMGAGLAGMSAAVKMAEDHPDLKVAVLTKVHPVRSHSGAAQGGINAAVARDDKWEDHYYDTLKGGWFLGDQDAVRVLTEQAPNAIYELDRWGTSFSRSADGNYAQRPFGGQRRNRTCYVQDITGHALLTTLFEQVTKRGVDVFWEWFVFSIVSDGKDFYGFLAFDLKTGKIGFFSAKAGLVATGGAGRVFGQSSNALINTGDGMALAWRAGVPLKDMEFFQTHPTGIPNGILITEGARGEGGYLVNKHGERFMEKYAPQFMELAPRDLVARSIHTEIVEGRGFDDGCVRLDLRHLGKEKLTQRLPQIREIAMYFAGVDPIDDPIPVRPTVHYTMGGVDVNTDCATPVRGLFAAGEAACVSVHGANRLGGNSLLETVVFGIRAAAMIPKSLGEKKEAPASLIEAEMANFNALFDGEATESVPALRTEMEKTMVAGLGIKRDAAGMKKGLTDIEAVRARFSGVRVANRNLTFNMEAFRAIELGCMLDIAYACAFASVAREESRGSHYHLDFPKMDNARFLKHSLVTREDGNKLHLDHLDVTIVDTKPLDQITY
ncbi:MAG: FAD-binding protein [Candidatus Lernaella stagnicola]|nr:FAD-binding protein [Candidatus Lernaella stagnicola]